MTAFELMCCWSSYSLETRLSAKSKKAPWNAVKPLFFANRVSSPICNGINEEFKLRAILVYTRRYAKVSCWMDLVTVFSHPQWTMFQLWVCLPAHWQSLKITVPHWNTTLPSKWDAALFCPQTLHFIFRLSHEQVTCGYSNNMCSVHVRVSDSAVSTGISMHQPAEWLCASQWEVPSTVLPWGHCHCIGGNRS